MTLNSSTTTSKVSIDQAHLVLLYGDGHCVGAVAVTSQITCPEDYIGAHARAERTALEWAAETGLEATHAESARGVKKVEDMDASLDRIPMGSAA
jgi:hypothetical protein